ncbi:DNA polymerase III sliding clamp (beta) subunit (PCNA family) [Roseimicrobium gellanilyticum]|uniref:Beta sliding clamp n=1 Tax=Roseimicrobium gellanilyticum TaxID=748857 RepID=A0A366HBR5_9BACT|nr:DNA polymerase III subunit beta [Roseimicrobium gellanilyticum]RBP38615.1 DNA polymerase III sliding clamp (beta) subunit (PCNA family) [Roseimicrobium gellanilyticum]
MNPISLPLNELKPALTGLSKVINRHTTLPILGGIQVERTADGWVCLTATDLDRFVTMRLEQPGQGSPCAMVVSFEDLQRLSKNCGKGETLQLEPASEDTALLRFPLAGQTGEAKIRAFPVGEFPEVPKLKGEPIPLPETLRQSLLEALECSSGDPGRYILQSACIDVSKAGAHYVVGTDGKHLYSSNSFTLPLTQSMVLPKHKFLGWRDFALDGNWRLKVTPSQETDVPGWVQLSSRRWRFITRQLTGNYPEWKVAVPDAASTKTTLVLGADTVEQVQQAINRLPCHEPLHQTIGIAWDHGEAALLAKAPEDRDWTRVPLPNVEAKGPDQRVFVDRRFLAKALGFGLCTIGLIDEISPLRFTEGGRQMIVMPLRPNGPSETTPSTSEVPAREAEATIPQATPTPALEQTEASPASLETPPNVASLQSGDHNASPNSANKSQMEHAIELVDELRAYHSQSQDKLRDLGTKLRIALREQKAGTKELHTFRQRLRALQAVQF